MAYSFFLKQARKNRRLSLRDAAAVLRMSPSTLNRYEEGSITHIPPEKLLKLIRFYGADPGDTIRKRHVGSTIERLALYEESQRRIDADYLYERWSSLDERGRRSVLSLLLHEADVSARLRLPKDPRKPQ